MNMIPLVVCSRPAPADASCSLCEEPVSYPSGIQIVESETERPVCPTCARHHAPELSALICLVEEAVRVGRIGRHTVVPPYTALLDLARAADDFSAALPEGLREAG